MWHTTNNDFMARGRAFLIATVAVLMVLIGAAGNGFAQEVGTVPGETISQLIARCAPTVHPETMQAIVGVESRGQQFAIADAGPVKLPWKQRKSMVRSFYMASAEEAVTKAQSLIANGHTVSLGLAQVNDRNLRRLGLSLHTIFDPCTNVAAGGAIMTDFYRRAVAKFGHGERALRAALSAYNSGDWLRGERDGYVALVYKHAGRPLALKAGGVRVPAIRNSGSEANTGSPIVSSRESVAARSAKRPQREFTISSVAYSAE